MSSSALFTGKVIVAKLAYARGIDPVGMLLLRMVFAMPFYACVLIWQLRHGERMERRDVCIAMFLGFIGYYVSSMLDFIGISYISTALERMILQLAPSFVMLIGLVFMRERFDRRLLAALALGYAGVALMVGAELGGAATPVHAAKAWLGVLCVCGATFIYALNMVWSERLMRRVNSVLMTSVAMMAACAGVFAHYGIENGFVAPTHDPVVIWLGIFMGVFCTVVPTYMNNEAIHLLGGARMGPFNYVGMGLTFVASAVVLDERFPLLKLAGILFAVAGALALTLGRVKKAKA